MGDPPPKVQWFKNNEPISKKDTRIREFDSGRKLKLINISKHEKIFIAYIDRFNKFINVYIFVFFLYLILNALCAITKKIYI